VKSSVNDFIRTSVILICALAFCSPLLAQEPQFDDLAKDMTDVLVKSRRYKVVVVDFFAVDAYKGPGEINDVGRKLADDFRAALLRRNHEIITEDRATMMDRLRAHDLVVANLTSPATVTWMLGDSGLDAWVSGEISNDPAGLKVNVSAYRVGAYFPEFEGEISIPFTTELKALVREKPLRKFPSIARAGENGISYPACIYCPQAHYTGEAVKEKVEGTVELEATIDEAGKAKDIEVKVGLPGGLTESAVEAVTNWRFKPATGPEGKPVAIRQVVQVWFRFG